MMLSTEVALPRKGGQEVHRDAGRTTSLGPSAFLPANRSSPEGAGQPRLELQPFPGLRPAVPPADRTSSSAGPGAGSLNRISLRPHPMGRSAEDPAPAQVPFSFPLPETLGGLGVSPLVKTRKRMSECLPRSGSRSGPLIQEREWTLRTTTERVSERGDGARWLYLSLKEEPASSHRAVRGPRGGVGVQPLVSGTAGRTSRR